MHTHTLKPRITIGDVDHRHLLSLAMSTSGRWAEAADELHDELERARVVPEAKLAPDVVRMGSSVEYRADDGEVRNVVLAYPGDADITAGRISVLTPVGTALIGLK